MAHDSELKAECERLYIDELLFIEEVCDRTKVPKKTFYRWRKDGNWEQQRDNNMNLQEKLGRLLCRLIDDELKEEEGKEINAQKIHGLVNTLKEFQKTKAVRERLIYVEDAEILLETLKEMKQFRELFEDPEVLSELGERLKEKSP